MIKFIYRFSSQQKVNYYSILELNGTCSQKQIKSNYLKLAKIYHPDVYKGTDINRFKQIQEAYNILKSPEKRAEYDRTNYREKPQTQQANSKQEENEEKDDQQSEQSSFKFKFKHSDYKNAKQENIQEDLKKFMDEPIKLDPDTFKIYENITERQMNKEHKQQQEEIFIKESGWAYKLRYQHVIGYKEQVKQYIQGLNTQFKLKPEQRLTMEKKVSLFFEDYGNIVIAATVMMVVPFVYSALSRRQEIEKDIKDDLEFMKKASEQLEYTEIQSRFVY